MELGKERSEGGDLLATKKRKEDHYLGSIPSGSRILSPPPLGILTDAMGRPAGGKWLSLKYLSRAGIKIPQTQTE